MDREEALRILDKRGLKPDHTGALPPLGGGARAQIRVALNWLRRNPAPEPAPKSKRKRSKKAE